MVGAWQMNPKDLLKTAMLGLKALKTQDAGSKVFYYHDVHRNNDATTSMSTPISLFEKHLEVLEKLGYHVVKTIENPSKEAMITFDDGFIGLYDNFDFFVKRQIPVTLFMLSGRLGANKYLTKEQLVELHKSGLVQIGSHTVSHRNLDELTKAERLEEMKKSKETLENLLGVEVTSFCYPRGRFNESIALEAAKTGYKYQYSCLPGNYADEVYPGVRRRNFVQHASSAEFRAWALGGGMLFEDRFRKLHIRESV